MANESEAVVRARELIRSFRQVYRTMTQLMRTHADTVGITPVQMSVIHTLAEEPNLSLGELSDRIQLGCSTVSGVVKRLVECGVVERDRLDEDQRTVSIRLTVKGKQLNYQLFDDDSFMTQLLDRFLHFPEEEIQTLLLLHQKLLKLLNAEHVD